MWIKNSMTENDWQEVDKSSREIVCKLFEKAGAKNIYNTKGLCSYDISCTLNGISISIEVKDRNMPHTQYSDMMVEQVKQDSNNKKIEKQQFKQCIVASVYTDNVICLASINDPEAIHKKKFCKCTTLIKGAYSGYVEKDVIFLPQRKKIKFEKQNDGTYKFTKI